MGKVIQPELFESPLRSREWLWDFFNAEAKVPVSISLTRNRVSMCSVRFSHPARIHLRLHEAFLSAPIAVLEALRKYLCTRRRRYWEPVTRFARSITIADDTGSVPRRRRMHKVHDLARLAEEVNEGHFNGRVRCRVEWGRARTSHRRGRSRSIRFGSYSPASGVVRIHPILDDDRVPEAFVVYILFHEMLHSIVPSRTIGGRRYDHPPEFRRLERAFPEFDKMRQLSVDLLDTLL